MTFELLCIIAYRIQEFLDPGSDSDPANLNFTDLGLIQARASMSPGSGWTQWALTLNHILISHSIFLFFYRSENDFNFAQSKLKFQFCLGKVEIRSLSNELLVRIEILISTRQN